MQSESIDGDLIVVGESAGECDISGFQYGAYGLEVQH